MIIFSWIRRHRIITLLCILALLCGGGLSWYFSQRPPETRVILQTNQGDIELKLFPEKAPTMTRNFLALAEAGKYDNTLFHRVIKDFIIQGGDYENFNGTGGQAYDGELLSDEIAPGLSHVRGAVSMANHGPNTNGSQFFIVQQDVPDLDGRYSIFGQVLSGIEVVDRIANMPTDVYDRPLSEVRLKKVVLFPENL